MEFCYFSGFIAVRSHSYRLFALTDPRERPIFFSLHFTIESKTRPHGIEDNDTDGRPSHLNSLQEYLQTQFRMPQEIALLTPISPTPYRPLLIYLPGMDGAGTLFHRQIPSLSPQFDIRCLSIPPSDLSDWEPLAESAIALIQETLDPDPKRKVYLCGESFGGCLALKITERIPELADFLILSNPATAVARQSLLGLSAGITAYLPDWFYQTSTWGFLPLLTSLSRTDASDRARLLKAMQSLHPSAVSCRLSMLHRFQFNADRLQSQSIKILIVASGSDRLMPSLAEAQRLQERLPQVQVRCLPDSGHACLLERDVELARILEEYDLLPTYRQKIAA